MQNIEKQFEDGQRMLFSFHDILNPAFLVMVVTKLNVRFSINLCLNISLKFNFVAKRMHRLRAFISFWCFEASTHFNTATIIRTVISMVSDWRVWLFKVVKTPGLLLPHPLSMALSPQSYCYRWLFTCSLLTSTHKAVYTYITRLESYTDNMSHDMSISTFKTW